MMDRPLDLTALERPSEEDLRRLGRAIRMRAAPELARRGSRTGPFAVLAGWARPTFAAAAVLATISLLGMAAARVGPTAEPLGGVPEELGLTAPVVEWVIEDRNPTDDDLLLAMEADL